MSNETRVACLYLGLMVFVTIRHFRLGAINLYTVRVRKIRHLLDMSPDKNAHILRYTQPFSTGYYSGLKAENERCQATVEIIENCWVYRKIRPVLSGDVSVRGRFFSCADPSLKDGGRCVSYPRRNVGVRVSFFISAFYFLGGSSPKDVLP